MHMVNISPPGVPPSPTNPYDFIVNTPGPPPKKKSITPMVKRMAVIACIIIVLLIGVAVFVSVSSKLGQANKETWASAARQQTELITVADIGLEKGRSSATKALAINTKLALESSTKELAELVKKSGVESKNNQSSSSQNEKELLLQQAETNNTFDTVFTETIKAGLADYINTLQELKQKSESQKTKTQLDEMINAISLLTVS